MEGMLGRLRELEGEKQQLEARQVGMGRRGRDGGGARAVKGTSPCCWGSVSLILRVHSHMLAKQATTEPAAPIPAPETLPFPSHCPLTHRMPNPQILYQEENLDLGRRVDELRDEGRTMEARLAEMSAANEEIRVRGQGPGAGAAPDGRPLFAPIYGATSNRSMPRTSNSGPHKGNR
jgi:hypothetical protein